MGLGVLCPGQGSQHPAMVDILAGRDAAESVLAEANAGLGYDLRSVLRSRQEMYRNRVAQPLLCAVESATWAALSAHLPEPRAVAGYSVGELAAYGCVGALSARELIVLARERARLMDAASKASTGLLALRGLPRPRVEALCRVFHAEIAIVIGFGQLVVGGERDALGDLEREAGAQGAVANLLPVDVAAHTSWLASAAEGFRAVLADSGLRDPAAPVLAGIDGTPVYERGRAIDALSRQIAATIEWATCLETMVEIGCTVLLELGPGDGLSRMARTAFPEVPVRSVSEFRTLRGVLEWTTRHL